MYTFMVSIHVVACLALILIVLLQTGRGAEMGAAFGGASQTLFGSTGGATFLSKLTTVAAVVFMVTCLGLTYLSSKPVARSIMEGVEVQQPVAPPQPVLPEATPVQPGAVAPQPQGATVPESAPPAVQGTDGSAAAPAENGQATPSQ